MRHGRSIGHIFYAVTLSYIYLLGLTGCSSGNNENLTIITSSLPNGTVNEPYSTAVSGSGGLPPYTWSVTPALPANLTFNTQTGAIAGTPVTVGTTSHTFTLQDSLSPPQAAQKTFTLTINPPPTPLSITTNSLLAGTVGQAYNQTVNAAGGTAPLTWSIVAGTLPQNLGLNPMTGMISGTPTAAGQSSFTVQVKDSGGPEQVVTQALSLTINPPTPPTITTSSPLPAGTVSQAYSQTLQASGGTGTLVWGVSAGAFPASLTLSSDGTISGTPTNAGTSNFTVRVTDALSQSATKAFSLTINPLTPPTITTPSPLPAGTVSQAFSQTLQASGGLGTLSWGVSAGALPANLTLSSTGTISGTPTNAGTSNFTVTVTDALSQSATKAFSLTINPPTPPTITTPSPLPGGTVGQAYSQTLMANGGTGTLSWMVSAGALPTNLTLSSTGTISGTPTNAGTSNFTVKVTDALSQSATKAFSLTISAALTITTTSPLPAAQVGHAYNTTLQRSGGVAPFTWSVTPALPAVLSLNPSTGQITGTPAAGTAGTHSLTFSVQDSSTPTQTASKMLSLTINP